MSRRQFCSVVIESREQLLVINVPKRTSRLVFTEKSEMGQELAKANVVGEIAKFAEYGEGLALRAGNHGNASPIFG